MTEVLLENGEIARITLNRPGAGNAFTQGMADGLLAAVLEVAHDPLVRVVTLSGAGRMFCVGGDVGDFAANGARIAPFLTQLAGALHQALAVLAAMEKPLIVLVNGPAAGAGMSLALAGDIVLADPSAHFSAAYGGIGLTPDGGMTWTLPRLVGLRRATEIVMTNRRVAAEEAAQIGLITRVSQDLDTDGTVLAETLAKGAVQAMGQARTLLCEATTETYPTQMDREAQAIAKAGQGAEGREGVAAFLDRRKPDFSKGQDNG